MKALKPVIKNSIIDFGEAKSGNRLLPCLFKKPELLVSKIVTI